MTWHSCYSYSRGISWHFLEGRPKSNSYFNWICLITTSKYYFDSTLAVMVNWTHNTCSEVPSFLLLICRFVYCWTSLYPNSVVVGKGFLSWSLTWFLDWSMQQRWLSPTLQSAAAFGDCYTSSDREIASLDFSSGSLLANSFTFDFFS